ncbi:MAG: vanadium-dependent haloperoxidase [Cyclobacteriaceae bacterium]
MKLRPVLITLITSQLLILTLLGCQSKNHATQQNQFNGEVITAWNDKIFKTAIEEDGLLTLKGLRTASLAHVAMHDALNTIYPKYTRYSFKRNTTDSHPIAAVTFAAYEVVKSQYPNKKQEWEKEKTKWLQNIESEGLEAGKKLGELVAATLLQQRKNDDWNSEANYTWHPMGPGVYAEFNEHSGTPEGFVFGAGWAMAQPFMLPDQAHFRSPPPPDISSEAYSEAFKEVKEYGSTGSKKRSDDQEHMAMWWKDFVENSHNRLARELTIKEELSLWETARLFALLNMTIYDAYINVFDNKFYYNHWRPYTAIRWAANDGNPNTVPDTTWNNLHQHTYAFPSYPSAHGTASTAAMTVLANNLGTGDKYHFLMITEEVDKAGPFSGSIKMNPPTRSFDSFSEAGLEASLSRIYLGIHFRYDSEEGHQLGKKIGMYANEHFLIPLKVN